MPSSASDVDMADRSDEAVPAQNSVINEKNAAAENDGNIGEHSDSEGKNGNTMIATQENTEEPKVGKAKAQAQANGLQVTTAQTQAVGNDPFTPDIWNSLPNALSRRSKVEQRYEAACHQRLQYWHMKGEYLAIAQRCQERMDNASRIIQNHNADVEEAERDIIIAEHNEARDSGRNLKRKFEGSDEA